MRAALLLLAACSGSPPPNCPSPLPSRMTDAMAALRWSDQTGCIELTYDPAFRDREAETIDAMKQWFGAECRKTCFEDPAERATPAEGERFMGRLHLAPLEL